MTDDDRSPLSDEDRMLAAEYALGVLDGPARAAAARRVERDRDFARAVDDWHAQLAPMLDGVEDVEPPAHVWRRIEGTIGSPDPASVREVAGVRDVAGPPPRQVIPPGRAFLLMMLGGALASFALVTLVGRGIITLDVPTDDPAPALVATLTPDGGAPAALARFDPSGTLTVRIAVAGDDGRVPELWLIPGDGVPRSLGVLPGGAGTIALPDGIVPTVGEALAVSLEPAGGSPTGAPTGPVIASGKLLSF